MRDSTIHAKAAWAFTLIEMMAAIAILIVLAGLLLPSFKSARLAALRARDTGNLRQVGAALLGYAGEHEQQLPGPTPLGQQAVYFGSMAKTTSPTLAFFLAPYLDCPVFPVDSPKVQTCPPLVSAGLRAVRPNQTAQLVNYLVNYGTTNLPSGHPLFGYYSPSFSTGPFRLPVLSQATPLNGVWALCDVDQKCTTPVATTSSWFATLAPTPVHGSVRNFLYLDGHVDALPASVQP